MKHLRTYLLLTLILIMTFCAAGIALAQGEGLPFQETYIAAGRRHIIGLRTDGTVAPSGYNEYDQCEVKDWRDIVAVAACSERTIGLRADGTVVATGLNDFGQCDVEGWSNIVAIAAGYEHTVGLRADGTVVAVGRNDDG